MKDKLYEALLSALEAVNVRPFNPITPTLVYTSLFLLHSLKLCGLVKFKVYFIERVNF
jgi:hypothetical protein